MVIESIGGTSAETDTEDPNRLSVTIRYSRTTGFVGGGTSNGAHIVGNRQANFPEEKKSDAKSN